MPSTRRRTFAIGGSKAVTLPWGMEIGRELSIAAGTRLLIADTTGEVPEDKLLQFFMEHVEPAFQRWWETQKRTQPVGQATRVEGLVTAQEATITPQPPIYDATCPNPSCGYTFPVDLGQGATGFCPRCGLRLLFKP